MTGHPGEPLLWSDSVVRHKMFWVFFLDTYAQTQCAGINALAGRLFFLGGGFISWGSHDGWNHKRGPSWARPCIPAHTGMITEPLISHMTLMQLPESAVGQKSRHGWLQIQIWKEPQQQTWPFKSPWIHKRCLKPETLQMSRKYSCCSSCWQHWWQFLLQSAASHTLMSDLLWS